MPASNTWVRRDSGRSSRGMRLLPILHHGLEYFDVPSQPLRSLFNGVFTLARADKAKPYSMSTRTKMQQKNMRTPRSRPHPASAANYRTSLIAIFARIFSKSSQNQSFTQDISSMSWRDLNGRFTTMAGNSERQRTLPPLLDTGSGSTRGSDQCNRSGHKRRRYA